MCWVAFDRAIRLATSARAAGPARGVGRRAGRDLRPDHAARLEPADGRRSTSTTAREVLDSALLRMARVGFIAPRDPRWLSTLDAMAGELVTDSLVYRYDPSASPDGLRGSEGTFSLCTFATSTRSPVPGGLDEARLVFEKMLTYANHLGLYSEEIALTGEQIGNFPQAFTHLALIDAAVTLDAALNRPCRAGRTAPGR